jgi:hypothetical protein
LGVVIAFLLSESDDIGFIIAQLNRNDNWFLGPRSREEPHFEYNEVPGALEMPGIY